MTSSAKRAKRTEQWAFSGVHELVLTTVKEEVSIGAHVLDLACGPGALAAALQDAGYRVTAADGFPEVFQYHDQIPFIHQMLEDKWDNINESFDAICAVEIIEHVENPYLFVRNCVHQLKPGGILIITTPNGSYFGSRLRFLHSSQHEFFGKGSFSLKTKTSLDNFLPGHLHCFSAWMLMENMKRSNLNEVNDRYNNDIIRGLFPTPRRPVRFFLHFYFRLLSLIIVPIMLFGGIRGLFSKNVLVTGRKTQ